MYEKINIFVLFLLINTILAEYLQCDIYNYDYYYVPNVNIATIKFNHSSKIIIDNKILYINKQEYNTAKYMGLGKFLNETDNKSYIINMLNNEKFYTRYNYPVGSHDNELKQWISISTTAYKYGTKVYIKEFDKTISINNKNIKHNGCFRVDDNNNKYNNCFIRIFTGEEVYNKNINDNTITIEKKDNCSLIDYA